ncbi:MAG: N-acetylmuramoyl-L-alanine amidase, partial [Pseudomonadota bacterium]
MRVKNGRLEGATGNLVPFKSKKFPVGNPKISGDKPRFLVIHYTAGGSAAGAISTFQSAKASAHLVIGHNGDITQMAKFHEV